MHGHLRIERLSQDVINRIAAGEVVQRPSAALKEMLENSIDAGATKVQIICQDGGLSVLQITDDGCGIYKDDLPLLCERFATSKLRTFDDLSSIGSFGFRGEALASISHVARVTVTTMRHDAPYPWMCKFVDGKLTHGPTVHPGNPGTCIRVEDLFYNAPVRKSSIGKPSEEYTRLLSVVQRYSICFPHIAFNCRNVSDGKWNGSNGSAKVDFSTQVGSTTLLNLKTVFGSSLASHLLRVDNVIDVADNQQGSITGFVSDPTLANKKNTLVLFVNQRLVESNAIRKCLDQVYAPVLVGGNRWFASLQITLPPQRVDVNVHPTKHEVMMVDEDAVLRALAESAKRELSKAAAAKQLHVGEVDHLALNLKPVSHSSTNVANVGHRGVVIAPCTMTRVTEQRGDMLKYAVKVDRFELVANHHNTNEAVFLTNVDASLPKASTDLEPTTHESIAGTSAHGVDAQEGTLHPPPTVSEVAPLSEEIVETALVSPQPVVTTSLCCSPADGEASPAQEPCVPRTTGLIHAAAAAPAPKPNVSMIAMIMDSDESDAEDDLQRDFKRHRVEEPSQPNILPSSSQVVTVPTQLPSATSSTTPIPQTAQPIVPRIPSPVVGVPNLTSVSSMIESFASQSPDDVRGLFNKMVFVGIVDQSMFFAQSGTTLFAVQTARLAREVAFQKLYVAFGRQPQVTFVDNSAPSVHALLHMAVEHGLSSEQRAILLTSHSTLHDAVKKALHTLRKWRSMLEEYFCVDMQRTRGGGDDLQLVKLPLVLGDAWPLSHERVPMLLWRLATDVDYSEEERCLAEIGSIIADELYGHGLEAGIAPTPTPTGRASNAVYDAVRFGLLPIATGGRYFYPAMDLLTDRTVCSVVTVEALYKVFERC